MNIPMVSSIVKSAACISVISVLWSCVQSTSTDQFNFPHYRFITTVDSEFFHLSAATGKPPWVLVLEGKPPNYFESGSAWAVSSTVGSPTNSTSRINSWFDALVDVTQLEVDPEGTMLQIKMLRRTETTDWGEWSFERQSDGHCFIKNEKLGPEFALTVDTSTTPYTASMASIDPALIQGWTIEAYLRPRNGFDTLCNGIADTI